MEWIISYAGTILIIMVLAAGIGLIIRKLVIDKKKGKSSCGCNCAHCAMGGACHQDVSHNHVKSINHSN